MTRRRAAAKIEVVVPGKKSISPSDTAQSSLSGTPGTNTPATSVSTGVESDAKKPRAVPKARNEIQRVAANARGRVQQASKRGTKRSASAMSAAYTQDDAALAEALQQEEYASMASARKRQKVSNQHAWNSKLQRLQEGHEVSDSADDFSDGLLTSDEGSHPPSLISDDGDYWDSEDGDEYLESVRAEAAAEVSGALNRVSSGPSASHQHSSHPNEEELDSNGSHYESEDDEVDPDEIPMSWDEMRKAGRAAKERKKLVSKHPVVDTMWDELKAQPILTPAPAQQPASITRKLKPFQLEGLSWMIEQEKSSYRGGLLGDEMGMGKTIQAVSLIMSDFPQPDPTLVIVPPVALMQWQKEIQVCSPLLEIRTIGD
jgi:DNA repair protein RAD16